VANFISPKEAASAAGVTTRTIYQWLEAGKLHFSETTEGETLICLDSLLQSRT
jgi:excisionase family DNA binding protein